MHRALPFGLILAILSCPHLSARRAPEQADIDDRAEVRRLLKEASELATQTETARDRALVFVRIGETSWKAGDKTIAAESFDRALKIVETLPRENFYDDPRETFRASIASLRARGGDIDGARQTLALIKSDSDKSSVISEIALAHARAKNFAEAAQTASAIQDSDWKDQTLEWIANQQAAAGDIQGATRLAHEIKNAQYRAQALTYIASLEAEGGQAEKARAVVQDALGAAEQTEPTEGVAGRSSLAACFSQEPEHPRDAALERVAVAQAQAGDTTAAMETLNRMHDKSGRENSLATIAGYQARSGDFAGARASIAAIGKDSCKTAALHGIVEAQFEAGNLSAALLTVDEMGDPYEKALTLTYLGEEVANQGALTSAMGILGHARVVANQIIDGQYHADILEGIARIEVKAGNRVEAAKTLAAAVPLVMAALEQDKREHRWSSALPDLIEQQAELGDLDGAWDNLGKTSDNDRTNIVGKAASAQSKAGDMQGALAWAARQISPRDKALALVGIAEGILERVESQKK